MQIVRRETRDSDSAARQQVCRVQGMTFFLVGEIFDVLAQVQVDSAEIPIRLALFCPIAHLRCNRQVLCVVLDGLV
jgi:hypothetical protein